TQQEVNALMAASIEPAMFTRQYTDVGTKNKEWNDIPVQGGELYNFDHKSTYIQEPPFFTDLKATPDPIRPINGARVLVMVGDSVTTDHISPAGSIKKDSPAGRYLMDNRVTPLDFNSYGSRRGNDRVMTRGTFANIRIRNLMAPGTEGGVTRFLPEGEVMSIYDAAMMYKLAGVPLVVLAGAEYGSGS